MSVRFRSLVRTSPCRILQDTCARVLADPHCGLESILRMRQNPLSAFLLVSTLRQEPGGLLLESIGLCLLMTMQLLQSRCVLSTPILVPGLIWPFCLLCYVDVVVGALASVMFFFAFLRARSTYLVGPSCPIVAFVLRIVSS